MKVFKNGIYYITFCKEQYNGFTRMLSETKDSVIMDAIAKTKKEFDFEVICIDLENQYNCQILIRCKKRDAYSIFAEYCKNAGDCITDVSFKLKKECLEGLIMQHTMRSAFKRWLLLHDEDFRAHGYVRVPNWFRHYIRKNKKWVYIVYDEGQREACARRNLDINQCRMFKGYYSFQISDDELLELQRAEWIK